MGQYTIRIVIDCKDYKTAVDVKELEAFMGLADDVGANKGAMVAACGFTSTAKRRARDAGIDLFRLVDTNNNLNDYLDLVEARVRDEGKPRLTHAEVKKRVRLEVVAAKKLRWRAGWRRRRPGRGACPFHPGRESRCVRPVQGIPYPELLWRDG